MLLIRLGFKKKFISSFLSINIYIYIHISATHTKKRYNSVTYVSFKDGSLINLFINFNDCPFVN
jgi:hypothetical protein